MCCFVFKFTIKCGDQTDWAFALMFFPFSVTLLFWLAFAVAKIY